MVGNTCSNSWLNSYTDNSIWIDRKFSYVSPQIVNRDKAFDIYLGNTNPNAIWFVECKSYAETTPIDVDQFIAYLSAINNLSNLRYVFNAKKLTLQQAKEKMQAVFRNNALSIWDAKPTLFIDCEITWLNLN